MSKMVKVLVFEPLKPPEIRYIRDELEDMQSIVGGYIESVYLHNGLAVICNEDGKLIGLPPNRPWFDEFGRVRDILHGTFFVVRLGGFGEIIDLTDEDINFAKDFFSTMCVEVN